MKRLAVLVHIFLLSLFFSACKKNEFAPEIADQEFSIEENSPRGTVIGVVEASDGDPGQILTYEIFNGNDEGAFRIDRTYGTLKVADDTQLDYESKTEYTLTLIVSDNHEKYPKEDIATLRVNILDVNEFAPVIHDQEFHVHENPVNGTLVGMVAASDPEQHQSLFFSIVGMNEAGLFEMEPQTGALVIADSTGIDYETLQQVTIRVMVEDDHATPLRDTADITVHIEDVLEITDGLVSYFSFSGDAEDNTGSGFHVEVNGALPIKDRSGNDNSAYLFDGVDDYMLMGSDYDLREKSISLYFRADDIPQYDFDSNPNDSWGSIFTIDHPGLQFGTMRLCVSEVEGENRLWAWKGGMEPPLNPGSLYTVIDESRWYGCSVTFGSDTVKLFLDGELAGFSMINGHTHSMDGLPAMVLGSARNANARFFKGIIDELYIHDRVLEEREIRDLSEMK